jgi:ribose 1,5-bisphosphokinase
MSNQGTLFYIMGASGSGKDSLIRCARAKIDPGTPIAFAPRYITRPVELEGENHIAVTETEFDRLIHYGCLAMRWKTNGIRYGVGIEILHWLEAGLNVVVNGSREYLPEAARTHPTLFPVLIHASDELLRERLMLRGRESLEDIELRLQRARALDELIEQSGLVVVDNNSQLEEACSRLIQVITSHIGSEASESHT